MACGSGDCRGGFLCEIHIGYTGKYMEDPGWYMFDENRLFVVIYIYGHK